MSSQTQLSGFVKDLSERRRARCFPVQVRSGAEMLIGDILALLFPHFSDVPDCAGDRIEAEIRGIEQRLEGLIDGLAVYYPTAHPETPSKFIARLPDVLQALELDAQAMYYGDPAAVSVDEVILSYPGFFAVAVHRIAHALYEIGVALLPRLISEHAHQKTGIDIHPAASIGRSFAIDHGTGIVIGETSVIGHGVKLYQGVTLGALSVQKALAQKKRHPTIGDNVVIYAGATILGGHTVIGADSIVGANAWVTESVPPFSVVGRHSEVRTRKTVEEDMDFNI
jgi:serine O-acetyltransferase